MMTVLLAAAKAFAQEAPDENWGHFPGQPGPSSGPGTTPPPPPPVDPSRYPLPMPPGTWPAAPQGGWPVAPPGPSITNLATEPPNKTSVFGAAMLQRWNRGEAFLLGFPLLQLRALIGVAPSVDVGLGFDSFYLSMNEPRLALRFGGLTAGSWSFAASLEGGWAFFTTRASREVRGARWITGHRNVNIAPAAVFSYQGDHARAARMFISLRYSLALDTEPFVSTPLGGVPPAVVLGHNVEAQVGAELPLSPKTSFVFLLGLTVHSRPDDAPVMPACAVGIVTGF
jgi:hypothetical protein